MTATPKDLLSDVEPTPRARLSPADVLSRYGGGLSPKQVIDYANAMAPQPSMIATMPMVSVPGMVGGYKLESLEGAQGRMGTLGTEAPKQNALTYFLEAATGVFQATGAKIQSIQNSIEERRRIRGLIDEMDTAGKIPDWLKQEGPKKTRVPDYERIRSMLEYRAGMRPKMDESAFQVFGEGASIVGMNGDIIQLDSPPDAMTRVSDEAVAALLPKPDQEKMTKMQKIAATAGGLVDFGVRYAAGAAILRGLPVPKSVSFVRDNPIWKTAMEFGIADTLAYPTVQSFSTGAAMGSLFGWLHSLPKLPLYKVVHPEAPLVLDKLALAQRASTVGMESGSLMAITAASGGDDMDVLLAAMIPPAFAAWRTSWKRGWLAAERAGALDKYLNDLVEAGKDLIGGEMGYRKMVQSWPMEKVEAEKQRLDTEGAKSIKDNAIRFLIEARLAGESLIPETVDKGKLLDPESVKALLEKEPVLAGKIADAESVSRRMVEPLLPRGETMTSAERLQMAVNIRNAIDERVMKAAERQETPQQPKRAEPSESDKQQTMEDEYIVSQVQAGRSYADVAAELKLPESDVRQRHEWFVGPGQESVAPQETSSTAKQPWEMTESEFKSTYGTNPLPGLVLPDGKFIAGSDHGDALRRAEDEGYTINPDKLGEMAGWKIGSLVILSKDLYGTWGPDMIHGSIVEKAASEGKPVPAKVLAEYGLKPKEGIDISEGPAQMSVATDMRIRAPEIPTAANMAFSVPVKAVEFASNVSKAPAKLTNPLGGMTELRGIPSSLLVDLARALIQKTPGVKKLRRSLGLYKGKEEFQDILIHHALGADPEALAVVLAHEIMHAADFDAITPEMRTLARGNLIGRLEVLKKFLQNELGGLNDAEMRAELQSLDRWWMPFDETQASESYVKYRNSARELYAQAGSVLLNAPAELQARAPKFFEALLARLDKKPTVLDAYIGIQQLLSGTPADVVKYRGERDANARLSSVEKRRVATIEAENLERSTVSKYMDWAEDSVPLFYDYTHYLKAKARPVVKREGGWKFYGEESEGQRVIQTVDELHNIDSAKSMYLRDVKRYMDDVVKPLGIGPDEVHKYVKYQRILHGDRSQLINPDAETPADARRTLMEQRKRLGEDKYASLRMAARHWHLKAVWPVVESARRAGLISGETFQKLYDNRYHYATFDVLDFIDRNVTPYIHDQQGTMRQIGDAFDATNLKMMSMARLAAVQKIAQDFVRFMQNEFPNEVREVKLDPLTGTPEERLADGKDHILLWRDGEKYAVEVDAELARPFRHARSDELKNWMHVIQNSIYSIWHPLFVQYSPDFAVRNLTVRDMYRTYRALAAIRSHVIAEKAADYVNRGVSKREAQNRASAETQALHLFQAWRKNWLPRRYVQLADTAWAATTGKHDAVVREMQEHGALTKPFVKTPRQKKNLLKKYAQGDEASWTEYVMHESGVKESRAAAHNIIGRAMEAWKDGVQWSEYAPKTVGWTQLKEWGVTGDKAGYLVRKYFGTPDPAQRGYHSEILNSWSMYATIRLKGMFYDADLGLRPRSLAAFWSRMGAIAIVPKVAMGLALAGAFGPYLKRMFDLIDPYYMSDYDFFPLGLHKGKDGMERVFGITMPLDDTSRIIGRIVWDAVEPWARQKRGENDYPVRTTVSDMFSDLRQEIVGSLSPPLDIAFGWMKYAAGINPFDGYRQDYVIPEHWEWKAFDERSSDKMVAWTFNKFGILTTITRPIYSQIVGEAWQSVPMTTTEIVTRSVPGLRSFFRISRNGMEASEAEALRNEEYTRQISRAELDKSITGMASRANYLQRLKALDRLDAAQKKEYDVLSPWYHQRYIPLSERIRAAKENGDTQESQRLEALLVQDVKEREARILEQRKAQ